MNNKTPLDAFFESYWRKCDFFGFADHGQIWCMPLKCPTFQQTPQHILKRYLSVCIIMSPERSDLFLTVPDIPHCKTDVLELNGLYIETNGGYRGHYFSEVQLV